jgi:hypothetical protein
MSFNMNDIKNITKKLQSANAMDIVAASREIADLALSESEPALKEAYLRLARNPKKDNGCIAKLAIAKAIAQLQSRDIEWFKRESRYVQLEPVFGGKRDAGIEIRNCCIAALTSFPWQQSAETIIERLGDTEPVVRMAAIKAISAYDGREPEHVILTKLVCGDPVSEVMGEIFRAMNSMEMENRIIRFEHYLRNESDDIRIEAAFALGESHLPEALQVLLRFWDEDILLTSRKIFLDGIALHKSAEARSFIRNLTDNPDFRATINKLLPD